MAESQVLRFESLLVEVRSDHLDDRAWLAEFLQPAFEPVGAGVCSRTGRQVALEANSEGLAALTSRTATARDGAIAFVLDSGPLRLPADRSGPELALLDGALRVGYLREPNGRVRILEAAGSPERARSSRVALMRVVREWGQELTLRSGGLVFHAGAIEHRGRAVLVSGPKGAGKTSLVAALLGRTPGLRLLANDRVDTEATGLRCWGLPTIVSVRPGTLDYLPELGSRLAGAAVDHTRRPGEAAPPRTLSDDRIGLSPSQWAHLLGVEQAAAARPVAIVYPRPEPGRARSVIRRLDPREHAERVALALFAAGSAGQASELCALPEVGPLPDGPTQHAAAGEFLQQLRGLEILLGADAYQADRLAELLAVAFD